MKALMEVGVRTKVLFAVIAVAILGVAPVVNTQTNDVEEVKKAFKAHADALRSGDVEAYLRGHHPQLSVFDADGGVLMEYTSRDEQRPGAQAAINSGAFANVSVRDLHVRTFGDDAALLTFYLVLSSTSPDGATSQTRLRRSELWVKENGQWMEVHGHMSML